MMRKKPIPPKRVSSVRTNNLDKERQPLENGDLSKLLNGRSTLNKNVTVTPQIMGSGSSIQQEPLYSNGSYNPRTNKLMTLSHSHILDETDKQSSATESKTGNNGHFLENSNDLVFREKSKPSEFDMLQRAPTTSLKFKHSTFKGASTSAFSLSQSSPESSLRSLFSKKGKYKFSNSALGTESASNDLEYLKPTTFHSESSRFHQSNSPDILFLSTRELSSKNEEISKRKVAMTYGTLRKSSTSSSSGSVSDLFQKSKSKVRNSLRNTKFFSRNLSTEDNSTETAPATLTDMLSSHNEIYDPTLVRPDDFENLSEDWLSQSHDSALFSHHKAQERSTKSAVPVKIPTLSREHSRKVMEAKNSVEHLTEKSELNLNKNVIRKISYHSPISNEASINEEKHNIYDGESTAINRNGTAIYSDEKCHTTSTQNISTSNDTKSSTSSLDPSKTPEQQSIEMLDCVLKDHSENRSVAQTSIQLSLSSKPPGGVENLHGTVVSMKELDDALLKQGKSELLENGTPSLPNINHEKGGVKPTETPPLSPSRPSYLPLENAAQNTFEGYSNPAHTVDVKKPGSQPLQERYGSPVVTHGMSVSDVLAQGYMSEFNSGLKTSSLPLNRSFNSQGSIYFERSSFDDASSFTESQDFVTSGSDDANIYLGNDILTRKTGWLIVKHLLTQKRGKLERATRRKWLKYWVKLQGNELVFYNDGENSSPENSNSVVSSLSIDGALVQPVPEHVTRNNVMCLSTNQGHAYLLQANTQTEIDGWIQAIHTEAATLFAKQTNHNPITRSNIIRILKDEIAKLNNEIDEDEKMRKMAELQMSLVTDTKNRKTITEQMQNWEENSEKNHVHVFRLRCYIASLEGKEQPNPRFAIAAVCKSSKQLLSNFKLFNIATLHSLVVSKQIRFASSARKHSLGINIKRSGSFSEISKDDTTSLKSLSSQTKSKKSLFGSLRGFDSLKGSVSSGRKKKREHKRAPVAGIIAAFTPSSSSHSSEKQFGDQKSSSFPRISSNHNDVTLANSDDQLSTPGTLSDDDILDGFNSTGGSLDSLLLAPPDAWCVPVNWDSSSTVRVTVPTGEFVTVTTTKNMTFQQLLEIVCQRKQLDSHNHYLINEGANGVSSILINSDLVSSVKDQSLKVKKKRMYSVELTAELDGFGFSVLPKFLCCSLVIESVSHDGVAEQCGLQIGEEIVMVNGKLTSPMDDDEALKALESAYLRLLVRTTHYETDSKYKIWWPSTEPDVEGSKPVFDTSTLSTDEIERSRSGHLMAVLQDYLQKIVVPPPPVTSKLQPSFIRTPFSAPLRKLDFGTKHDSVEDIVNMLIVPPPQPSSLTADSASVTDQMSSLPQPTDASMLHSGNDNHEEVIDKLLKKAEALTKMCRRSNAVSHDKSVDQSEAMNNNIQHHQLSDFEKIWKVVRELVDTEINYVKDLDCLLKRFLLPLSAEGFFSHNKDMEALLHCVKGILLFQETFLQDLKQSLNGEDSGLDSFILNRSLLSLTSTFLQHAGQFKLYAVFSTYHSVAQDLIEQTKSASSEMRIFLEARNPKHQHSLSLDSYLIKPIQRVLKYPLLLRELLSLSEVLDVVSTKTRRRLRAALHAMHGVARHINDSQTVHDEFGNEGFDEIMKMACEKALNSSEIIPKLDMSELLCYCTTEWQNAPEEVSGKLKKGNVMEMLVFVFRTAIVLLCQSVKQRDKKKAVTPFHESVMHRRNSISDFTYYEVIPGLQLYINGKSTGNILEICKSSPTEIKTYRLLADSLETKQRTAKTIRYVIKDCARTVGYCATSSENFAVPHKDNAVVKEEELIDCQAVAEDAEVIDTANGNEGIAEDSSESVKKNDSGISWTKSNQISSKVMKNFFYQPEDAKKKDENTSSSPDDEKNSKNKIPMTVPLPTYDVAVSSIAKSCDKVNEKSYLTDLLYSTYPRTSSKTSSAMVSPSQSLPRSEKSHRISKQKYKNSTEEMFKPHVEGKKSVKEENTETENAPIRRNDVESSPEYGDHQGYQGNNMNMYSKGGSPARYNMIYGVSPYESKL